MGDHQEQADGDSVGGGGGGASSTSSGAAAGAGGPGSKMYKTTLCQFYLQGPCKNGDNCNYAHGTSELRTASGKAVKDVEEKMHGKGEGQGGHKSIFDVITGKLFFGYGFFAPPLSFSKLF